MLFAFRCYNIINLAYGFTIYEDCLPVFLWCALFIELIEVHPSEEVDVQRTAFLVNDFRMNNLGV